LISINSRQIGSSYGKMNADGNWIINVNGEKTYVFLICMNALLFVSARTKQKWTEERNQGGGA
jgi:hypothetical protein